MATSISLNYAITQINNELQSIAAQNQDDSKLFSNYVAVNKLSKNLDYLRKSTYRIPKYKSITEELHSTDKFLTELAFELDYRLKANLTKHRREEELELQKQKEFAERSSNVGSIQPSSELEATEIEGESIDNLRKRLLSTRNGPSQLDSIQTVEDQNNYQDTFQQELIDALPSMVSTLKQQAVQFQQMLKNDAVILKEATENFENSTGKFERVSQMLTKYHKEGKLSIWFYIRVIGAIVITTMFLLLLIRLIPARY
ncbi:hypothetical protein CANARDRAFT_27870 [[Candida] arabinofermentans NRRL YB-2248]|uniref:Uncharacterized protein n=1 Tax=[Candida] arabinofermentans NRRL YB-2248 TaxID=983967 RepID=A0A1E4T1Z7_9ASCO|nr:hypothetical protein CANARDRAFT_27870 [[Candida] arabinofermentans NRRL YB-2248]